jgi:hypothetical protein
MRDLILESHWLQEIYSHESDKIAIYLFFLPYDHSRSR